jgi:hypothetical protein
MYSVVLMVAATSGGDMASFGKDRGGCNGCAGWTAGSGCKGGGFLGMRDRGGCRGGGFLGHKDKGGCHGMVVAGCTGTSHAPVMAAPMPAPVAVAAPAGCHGGGSGCHGSASAGCHGCKGGGFLGLRDRGGCSGGGFLGKNKGCHGGCW